VCFNQILYVAAKSGDTEEDRKRKLSRCGENAAQKQSEIIAENCAQLCRAQWAEGVVGGGEGRGERRGRRQEKNTAVFSNEWQPHVRRIVCKVRTIEK
jgi:hypothetical protein